MLLLLFITKFKLSINFLLISLLILLCTYFLFFLFFIILHVNKVLEGLDYLHTKCKIIHTDLKPENVLICVSDEYVKHLADESAEWLRLGIKPPASVVSTAPTSQLKLSTAKSMKNRKKKEKKKKKRQQEQAEKTSVSINFMFYL